MTRPALFLDRDGTLVHDPGYLGDPGGVELLPGTAEGLRLAVDAGLLPVVISNQSGVARGFYSEDDLTLVDAELRRQLAAEGVTLEHSYYCVHGPDDECVCRKPLPGLIERAVAELDLDVSASIMVGDREGDIEAGLAAGCTSVAYGFTSERDGVRRIDSLTELFEPGDESIDDT